MSTDLLLATDNVVVHAPSDLPRHLPRWESWLLARGPLILSRHPGWLLVLQQGLGHVPYCLEATRDGRTTGLLPLVFVDSWLFGRFLVSLPYLNYGGPIAEDDATARRLVDRAVTLADQLRVKHLELREEQPTEHPALTVRQTSKVHMHLALEATVDEQWKAFDKKTRNQIRKGEKQGFSIAWGGEELVPEFHAVFSQNMRDLGTPTYGSELFRAAARQFPGQAEFCVVRHETRPVAVGFLTHGWGFTEVPSASSLRECREICPNMVLFQHLIQRAIERGSKVFDFGRSTIDSSTHRFKKQWGAEAVPATWQYYVRQGQPGEMRRENPKYERFIRCWQKLPLWLTRLAGPWVVRGIP